MTLEELIALLDASTGDGFAARRASIIEQINLLDPTYGTSDFTADPTIVALAGLDATTGVIEQTGTDAFTKRAIGVGSAASLLTRADGDGRYATSATVTSGAAGLAPASGGGTSNYLRADGTWTAPSGGSGSVTTVSVTTANGVSGSIATATTTPAISLTLGAITPSSVAASGTVSGSNLSGTNTGDQTITLTGDVTGSGTGSFATAIGSNKVTNGMLAQVATATFQGRTTASTGNVETLTATQATALLDTATTSLKGLLSSSDKTKLDAITGTNTGDQTITLTGDVVGSGTGSFATTIGSNKVTLSNLAQIASGSFHARATASTGNVEALTGTQATTLLDTFTSSLKGLAPSSGGGTLNYLRADGTWAALDPISLTQAPASSPAAGSVSLGVESHANFDFLAFQNGEGIESFVQPHLSRNRMMGYLGGFSTTALTALPGSQPIPTTLGTGTGRATATTNRFTREPRLGFVSAAGAGSFCGSYQNSSTLKFCGLGDGSGNGGFLYISRFGVSDAATVSGARMFVGLDTQTTSPTNVEPNTIVNAIGVAQLSSSNNLQIVYGGSTAQTAIDLGSSFPANTLSVDMYEFMLFSPPTDNTKVYYRVLRINTGDVASGTLTNTTPGTTLPATSTLLAFKNWRCNNATALACGLDIAVMTVSLLI